MIRTHTAIAAVLTLCLSACTTARPKSEGSAGMRHMSRPPATQAYRFRVGDELSIKFYKNPELDEDVVVRPDGMISLQLIGDVRTAGLEPVALRALLAQRYATELANPKIAVIVRTWGAQRVHVGGEVATSGAVPLTPGLTLVEAIQEAGGLLETAHDEQVILIRRELDGDAQGYAVNLRPILSGRNPEADVWLQASDIVFVPRSPVANINLFVKQYIRGNLPVEPGIGYGIP